MTMAVDRPVPNSCGMTCMNMRSWSEQSFMMAFVRSDRSRRPKNDSGSRRRCSARSVRLRALSSYTLWYVFAYSAHWVRADEREDADAPREVRRQRGQRGPRHEVVHEVAHQQEQDADRGHEHEVRQRAEEHAAPEVLRAHVGEAQGITQHSRPPFRCAIAPRFDSRPTCARTSRPPPPARRGSPAPRGGRRPARRWRRRRPRWTAGARS